MPPSGAPALRAGWWRLSATTSYRLQREASRVLLASYEGEESVSRITTSTLDSAHGVTAENVSQVLGVVKEKPCVGMGILC